MVPFLREIQYLAITLVLLAGTSVILPCREIDSATAAACNFYYSVEYSNSDFVPHEQTLLGKRLAAARVLDVSVARVPTLLIRRYS